MTVAKAVVCILLLRVLLVVFIVEVPVAVVLDVVGSGGGVVV